MWATVATPDLCEKHKHKPVWETVISARPLKNGKSQETRDEEEILRVGTLEAQGQGGRTVPLGEQSVTEQTVASTAEK